MRNIEDLRKECQRVLGREAVSPTDFSELSLKISNFTGRNVSVSTLKRIWGYVSYTHTPSNEILSILSAFVGYRDWHDFRNADTITESSDFIGNDIIQSSNLMSGNHIQICWKPDRRCIVEYIGNSEFRVIKAENSKLKEDDVFSCGVMAKGEPLLCHEVRRGGKLLAEGYVAGKSDGIISLHIIQ